MEIHTEMTTNSANLFLKYLVVEPSFELALTTRSGSDIHCCLSTSKDDEIFLWSDGGAVQRGISDISFHDLEISCVNELEHVSLNPNGRTYKSFSPLQFCLLTL